MIIIDSFCLSMSLNGAFDKLTKTKPMESLLCGKVLLSMGLQLFLVTLFQFGFFVITSSSMSCYYAGLVTDDRAMCACTFISDPNTIYSPATVPAGNYTYPELDGAIVMTYENATFECENDGDCSLQYNMQLEKEYNLVKLPTIITS